jgi:hypothetical protein
MAETYTCWKCGTPLPELLLPVSRQEECADCRAELHVCRMCEFFDTAAPQQCRERVADNVAEKSRANFCGYFRISPRAFTASPDQAATTCRELDALFGDASDEAAAETGTASDTPGNSLDDLFRK